MNIGAGKLSRENLPEDRIEILDNIHSIINSIRQQQGNENIENIDFNSKEKPTNFISILGGRGAGKTSIALTILEELKNKKGECEEIPKIDSTLKETKNVILNIIDPAMFGVEKNALGWVIYLFQGKIKNLKKEVKALGYCGDDKKNNDLDDIYNELKATYIQSRPFYRENLATLSEGNHEYQKINEKIMYSEIELAVLFRKFIDIYIKVLKDVYSLKEQEPLILITFDDIDLSPQYGPEILETVLNYLAHPNIVVFILGSYETFREALMMDMWNKENIPQQFDKETVINNSDLFDEVSIRTDDILGKVLPAHFRFYLKGLGLKDRLTFTPYGNKESNKLFELLDDIKINKINITHNSTKEIEEYSLLKWFIEPIIRTEKLYDKVNHIKLEPSQRVYQGFIDDKLAIENYNEKTKCDREKIDEDISFYLENNKENKHVYEISPYSFILGETPRSLINCYYNLKNETDKKIVIRYSTNTSFGKTDKIHSENFNALYMIYKVIRNTNLEINYNRDKFKIDELVRFDKEKEKVFFDFRMLRFTANEEYRYRNHNVSQELLDIKYQYEIKSEKQKLNEEKEKVIFVKNIDLNNAQSAFIQFFYDLCYEFLNENYIIVRGEIDLSNIPVYKRQEDNIEIKMINFKLFNHYYIFQKLHELNLPLIIRDRKVHRNIRDRLKLYFINVLDYLQLNFKDKLNNEFEWKYESENIDDVLIKKIMESYYGDQFDNYLSIDYQNNKVGIINFIRFFKESRNPYEDTFEYYIENDTKIKLYNELVCYITNSLRVETRLGEIQEILGEINTYLQHEELINYKCIKELKIAIKSKKWEQIRLDLFNINCIFIAVIIKSVYNDDFLTTQQKIEQITKIINISSSEKEKIKRIAKQNKSRYDKLYEQIHFIAIKVMEDISRNKVDGIKVLEEYINKNETLDEKSSSNNEILEVVELPVIEVKDEISDDKNNRIEIYKKLTFGMQKNYTKKYLSNLMNIVDEYKWYDELLSNFKNAIQSNDSEQIKNTYYEIIQKYVEMLLAENKRDDINIIIEEVAKSSKEFESKLKLLIMEI